MSVYVEHGSSVDAGLKERVSPLAFQTPATAGLSKGIGEPENGTPERWMRIGAVPFVTVLPGRARIRVLTIGFGVAGADEDGVDVVADAPGFACSGVVAIVVLDERCAPAPPGSPGALANAVLAGAIAISTSNSTDLGVITL